MTLSESRLLVIDDNEDVLTALRLLFERRGAAVHTATSPAAVPALFREGRFDAVLLDMNFARDASSGQEGLLWLERILSLDPAAAVVLITAYSDVEVAVEAMKRGAVDFVSKPWQNEKMLATVAAAVQLRRTRAEAERLRIQRDALGSSLDERFPDLLGDSPPMRRVLATVEKVAATDANVLVLGENGTGKELVARALHRLSPRAPEVFVSVDVGALPESLFESELFGYVKGAFTGAAEDRAGRFEAADGGTLFLDEIGNMSLAQQARLLTALQTRTVTRLGETRPRPVDLRLVAATNQPIHRRVAEGAFRQDLLYRLNTVEIYLPPLRERTGDVPVLAA
ncbi:MAG TPA: sigma-54 dependent transcriptional regulator, partial [Rhodothermales bacterium]|nr:sigma-54 dependent transcriptional regulator [Rhodothermales bacterium]